MKACRCDRCGEFVDTGFYTLIQYNEWGHEVDTNEVCGDCIKIIDKELDGSKKTKTTPNGRE